MPPRKQNERDLCMKLRWKKWGDKFNYYMRLSTSNKPYWKHNEEEMMMMMMMMMMMKPYSLPTIMTLQNNYENPPIVTAFQRRSRQSLHVLHKMVLGPQTQGTHNLFCNLSLFTLLSNWVLKCLQVHPMQFASSLMMLIGLHYSN